MGFYDKYCLPKIVDLVCRSKPNMRQREKVVPLAKGVVLEVGIGSGLNLPFYNPAKVEHVFGVDPSEKMVAMAKDTVNDIDFSVEFLISPGEEIQLDDKSIDTVLITYTLCTIPNTESALSEMRRVLKPNGEFIFCEHGMAPDYKVRRWQERIEPIWKKFSGGCHLSRPILQMIKDGGFEIKKLETMYLPGWKPASYNYWGTAVIS